MLKNTQLPEVAEIQRRLGAGECPASLCGWDDQGLNVLREIGEYFLSEARYEDAVDLFLFLTAMAPQNSALWTRLGNAEQECGRCDAALEAYSLAVATDPEDPLPHIFSAECYGLVGDSKDEISSLLLAYGICEEHNRETDLKDELLEAIQDLVGQYPQSSTKDNSPLPG